MSSVKDGDGMCSGKDEAVRSLNCTVMELLSEIDPMGVQPGHVAPESEYRLEADCLTDMLARTGQVSVADIRNVGVAGFDEPDWMSMAEAQQLRLKLNSLIR